MKKLPFFIVLSSWLSVCSILMAEQPYARQMREAEAYFEAKQYAQAVERYENLLQTPLEQWQRAVLMYDMGCVFLAAGEWDQAKATFNSISLDNHLGPVLDERIQRNLMLLYMRQAESLSDSSNDRRQAIDLLYKAIDLTPQVDQASCRLQQAEGVKECIPSYGADIMRKISIHFLAGLLQKEEEARIRASSLREGLALLLQEDEYAISDIDFLINHKMHDKLKIRYGDLYNTEWNQALPLWNSQREKLINDKIVGTKEGIELFERAEKEFKKGVELLEKKQENGAKGAFAASAEALRMLLEKLPPPPPSGGKGGEKEQKASQEQGGKKSPAQLKEEEADKTVQQLLQMEQQDRKLKPSPQIHKKELRPW